MVLKLQQIVHELVLGKLKLNLNAGSVDYGHFDRTNK
jgi:hypothetical protein